MDNGVIYLTHWGRVTHICVGKLTIIGSDNGLSPERRQAIICTNADILLIGPLGTNFSEILIEIQTYSLKNIRLKMSSAKCCSFRLGLNVLIVICLVPFCEIPFNHLRYLICQEVRTDPRSHTGRDAKTKLKGTLCHLLQGDRMVGCRINSLVPRRRSCNVKFNIISLISPWTKWPPSVLADDNFKCIFLNASDRIPIRISLTFVPRSPIDAYMYHSASMSWVHQHVYDSIAVTS